MFCPDCDVFCEEFYNYWECPECGTRYDIDSDPEDPELFEEDEYEDHEDYDY